MLEMQDDVVLVRAAAAALADLDRHRARLTTSREARSLARRRVALHEALALAVGEVAALAARALGDQAAGAVDAGRVELDELHVLQRQAGAQHHARCRRRCRCAPRCSEDRRGRSRRSPAPSCWARKRWMRAVVEVPGHDAAAGASSSMIRSSAKYSTKNSASCLQRTAGRACAASRGRCGRRRRRCAAPMPLP